MKAFSTVVFDLDDTLYPEVDFVRSGFKAVAKHVDKIGLVNADLFYQTAWDLFVKGFRRKIFDMTFERFKLEYTTENILDLVRTYREHLPDIRPFTGSDDLLSSLKEQGYILALISDGPYQTQLNKVRALGLEGYFDHLLLTDAYGPSWSKPNLHAFLEVMKRTRSEASRCVYVADNPRKDFLGPNILGWHTIRVRYKIGLYYDEVPAPHGEPKVTVENLTAIRKLLVPCLGQNQ